ncbi:MAG TPA: PQQ-dependent sugar dehydrogenase [Gemmatimonadaceae bacterium]|nr:PQQ-dependent sugar dehydrogenase [Gemmatimonadaceae bacterium]
MKLILLLGASVLLSCRGQGDSIGNEASAAPSSPASNASDSNVALDAPPVAQARLTATTVRLEQVGDRFRSPVFITSPPGDSRLFVVEQAGRIRVLKQGRVLDQPFLDISARVRSGGEQGLLSMAFHPDYGTNRWFYVNFTDRNGDTHIERFTASANADVADLGSMLLVLKIDQPYSNHNGGLVMFGPDGMLYIGMGDGGSGGDPQGNGQNPRALLGKMLRVNVSRAEPYTIPAGNPFANGQRGAPEVWATGIRNPWRFSFDRSANLLYIGDVGQNRQEEINVAPASRAGINYGWNIMEGSSCFRSSSCDRDGLHAPAVSISQSDGACSVIGGYVYRGRRIPEIVGHYFYSDYCAGWLRSFRYQNGAAADRRSWKIQDIGNVVSFGEDSSGELYIVAENGRIYRFAGVS